MDIATFKNKFTAFLGVLFFFQNTLLAHVSTQELWEKRRFHLNFSKDFSSKAPLSLPKITKTFSSQAGISEIFKTIPSAWGRIKKENQYHFGRDLNFILHVQDIHQNREAQKNIAALVERLVDHQSVDLIALEGEFGEMRLGALKKFPRQQSIQVAKSYLFKNNRITGPVAALLSSKSNLPPIIGIDDKELYELNVQAYRNSLQFQELNLRELAEDEKKLLFKENNIENKKLLSFYHASQSYHRNKSSLSDFVFNFSQADVKNKKSLSNLRQSIELERSIHFPKAEEERNVFIQILARKLSQEKLNELLSTSADFKLGKMTEKDFYDFVVQLGRENNIDLKTFKEFGHYLQYVALYQTLDIDETLKELTELETEIYQLLIKNKREAEFVKESQRLWLSEKLVKFSLTREEWDKYKETPHPNPLPDGRGDKSFPLRSGGARGGKLRPFEEFYRLAELRDQKMADNLEEARQKYKSKRVLLITGGFHSNGIKNHFVKKHENIFSFIPRITKIEKEVSSYLTLFAQEKTSLDDLFEGRVLFLSPRVMPSANGMAAVVTLADQTLFPQVPAKESWTQSGGESVENVSSHQEGNQMTLDVTGARQGIKLTAQLGGLNDSSIRIESVRLEKVNVLSSGIIFPFLEAFIRWGLVVTLSVDPFLSLVIIFPLVHVLMHALRDIQEVGIKGFIRRIPQRFFVSAFFGLFSALILFSCDISLISVLVIVPDFFLHSLYNLKLRFWLDKWTGIQWLEMSVNPQGDVKRKELMTAIQNILSGIPGVNVRRAKGFDLTHMQIMAIDNVNKFKKHLNSIGKVQEGIVLEIYDSIQLYRESFMPKLPEKPSFELGKITISNWPQSLGLGFVPQKDWHRARQATIEIDRALTQLPKGAESLEEIYLQIEPFNLDQGFNDENVAELLSMINLEKRIGLNLLKAITQKEKIPETEVLEALKDKEKLKQLIIRLQPYRKWAEKTINEYITFAMKHHWGYFVLLELKKLGYPPPFLLNVDSHSDLSKDGQKTDSPHAVVWVQQAYEDGLISGYLQIGLRPDENGDPKILKGLSLGIENGVTLADLIEKHGYVLSIDLDVLSTFSYSGGEVFFAPTRKITAYVEALQKFINETEEETGKIPLRIPCSISPDYLLAAHTNMYWVQTFQNDIRRQFGDLVHKGLAIKPSINHVAVPLNWINIVLSVVINVLGAVYFFSSQDSLFSVLLMTSALVFGTAVSFLIHESGHLLENKVRGKKLSLKRISGGFMYGGVGVKGASGWSGIAASVMGGFIFFSLIFIDLNNSIIYGILILINIVFMLSPGDWKNFFIKKEKRKIREQDLYKAFLGGIPERHSFGSDKKWFLEFSKVFFTEKGDQDSLKEFYHALPPLDNELFQLTDEEIAFWLSEISLDTGIGISLLKWLAIKNGLPDSVMDLILDDKQKLNQFLIEVNPYFQKSKNHLNTYFSFAEAHHYSYFYLLMLKFAGIPPPFVVNLDSHNDLRKDFDVNSTIQSSDWIEAAFRDGLLSGYAHMRIERDNKGQPKLVLSEVKGEQIGSMKNSDDFIEILKTIPYLLTIDADTFSVINFLDGIGILFEEIWHVEAKDFPDFSQPFFDFIRLLPKAIRINFVNSRNYLNNIKADANWLSLLQSFFYSRLSRADDDFEKYEFPPETSFTPVLDELKKWTEIKLSENQVLWSLWKHLEMETPLPEILITKKEGLWVSELPVNQDDLNKLESLGIKVKDKVGNSRKVFLAFEGKAFIGIALYSPELIEGEKQLSVYIFDPDVESIYSGKNSVEVFPFISRKVFDISEETKRPGDKINIHWLPSIYPLTDYPALFSLMGVNPRKDARVLDLLTGAGQLGVMFSKMGAKKVVSTGISPAAVVMAKVNAQVNGVNEQMQVYQADGFHFPSEIEHEKFDEIYTNPPWPRQEKDDIRFSDVGMKVIKEILSKAQNFLSKDGILVLNYPEVPELFQLIYENNWDIVRIEGTKQNRGKYEVDYSRFVLVPRRSDQLSDEKNKTFKEIWKLFLELDDFKSNPLDPRYDQYMRVFQDYPSRYIMKKMDVPNVELDFHDELIAKFFAEASTRLSNKIQMAVPDIRINLALSHLKIREEVKGEEGTFMAGPVEVEHPHGAQISNVNLMAATFVTVGYLFYLFAYMPSLLATVTSILVVSLFIFSVLFHELGHALSNYFSGKPTHVYFEKGWFKGGMTVPNASGISGVIPSAFLALGMLVLSFSASHLVDIWVLFSVVNFIFMMSLKDWRLIISGFFDSSQWKSIVVDNLKISWLRSVFPPMEDNTLTTEILYRHSKKVVMKKTDRIWELCAGAGLVAISAAKRGAGFVLATDINPEAVKSVKKNAKDNKVKKTVQAETVAGLGIGDSHKEFDRLFVNLPWGYQATDHPNVSDPEFKLLNELLMKGQDYLTENGTLHVGYQEIPTLMARIYGNDWDIVLIDQSQFVREKYKESDYPHFTDQGVFVLTKRNKDILSDSLSQDLASDWEILLRIQNRIMESSVKPLGFMMPGMIESSLKGIQEKYHKLKKSDPEHAFHFQLIEKGAGRLLAYFTRKFQLEGPIENVRTNPNFNLDSFGLGDVVENKEELNLPPLLSKGIGERTVKIVTRVEDLELTKSWLLRVKGKMKVEILANPEEILSIKDALQDFSVTIKPIKGLIKNGEISFEDYLSLGSSNKKELLNSILIYSSRLFMSKTLSEQFTEDELKAIDTFELEEILGNIKNSRPISLFIRLTNALKAAQHA
ncbi:MAG: methyltransferase [Elusimicrobiota bacterium]